MKMLALLCAISLSVQDPAPAPNSPPQEQPAKIAIYDENADASADIAAALARAKDNNRRVLIQWGANWCVWCVRLHELAKKDAKIARTLKYEYDVVLVDIGDWKKNMELAAKYGADLKGSGVPYLTVLDATGKPLANQDTGALEDKPKNAHDPARVLEFLQSKQAPYERAEELLAAAQAQARIEKTQVFLTFGAPWCGWCHKLENWMATPLPKALLAKDFVIRKIDVDRTLGGAELKARHGGKEFGLPWFCILDAQGKVRGASLDAEGKNIGFPYQDSEIMAFATLLSKVARNLSLGDIDKLQRSLVDVREADLRKQQEKAQK